MNLCFEETPEKRPTASFLRELLEEVWCTKGLSDSFVWFNIRTKTLNKCKIQLIELLKYQKMLSIPAVRGVQAMGKSDVYLFNNGRMIRTKRITNSACK